MASSSSSRQSQVDVLNHSLGELQAHQQWYRQRRAELEAKTSKEAVYDHHQVLETKGQDLLAQLQDKEKSRSLINKIEAAIKDFKNEGPSAEESYKTRARKLFDSHVKSSSTNKLIATCDFLEGLFILEDDEAPSEQDADYLEKEALKAHIMEQVFGVKPPGSLDPSSKKNYMDLLALHMLSEVNDMRAIAMEKLLTTEEAKLVEEKKEAKKEAKIDRKAGTVGSMPPATSSATGVSTATSSTASASTTSMVGADVSRPSASDSLPTSESKMSPISLEITFLTNLFSKLEKEYNKPEVEHTSHAAEIRSFRKNLKEIESLGTDSIKKSALDNLYRKIEFMIKAKAVSLRSFLALDKKEATALKNYSDYLKKKSMTDHLFYRTLCHAYCRQTDVRKLNSPSNLLYNYLNQIDLPEFISQDVHLHVWGSQMMSGADSSSSSPKP